MRIRFVGVWETVGALGIPDVLPVASFRHPWLFHNNVLTSGVEAAYQALAIDEQRPGYTPTLWQMQRNALHRQVLQQVWFPGGHEDVGGGRTETGLSDISLLWMKERAQRCGLRFREGLLEAECSPNALAQLSAAPGRHRHTGERTNTFGSWSGIINEVVHQSAVERLRRDPSYKPPYLVRYLERGGRVVQ